MRSSVQRSAGRDAHGRLSGGNRARRRTAMTTQTTTVLDKIVTKSGGLYDGVTGKAFTPRGVDYVRLAKAADGSTYHSTFEPGQYSSATTQAVLNNIKTSSGYNTVGVFIAPGEFTTPSHGISTGVSSMTPINAAPGPSPPPGARPHVDIAAT